MILIVSPYRYNIQHSHAFDQLGKMLFPVLETVLSIRIFHCEEFKRKKVGLLEKFKFALKATLLCRPIIIANHWPKTKKLEFTEFLNQKPPDLIHFEYFQSTYVNKKVRKIGYTYTLHDSFQRNNPYVLSKFGFRKVYLLIQYCLLILHENTVIRNAKKVFVFNSTDYEYVKRKRGNPVYVEVGIQNDLQKWTPSNLDLQQIVFAGALWRKENEEICFFIIDHILPKLLKILPCTKFLFLGSSPSNKLIEIVERTPGTAIRANVEHFAEEVSKSSLSLCLSKVHPGISMKFLQSLKIGIPTIANTNVAYSLKKGLLDPEFFILADSPNEICLAIEKILLSEEVACNLSVNAKNFMEKHYTTKGYFDTYIRNFTEILSGGKVY